MSFSMSFELPTANTFQVHTEHHRNYLENVPCLFCEKPIPDNNSKCHQCKIVRYCSYKCQLAHWPRHRHSCEEFKKHTAIKRGSSHVTTASSRTEYRERTPNTKDGKKGKENQTMESKVSARDEIDSSLQCSSCKRYSPGLRTCSKCKTVKYCDPDCQRKHWPQHKKDCKKESKAKEVEVPKEKRCALCKSPSLDAKKCSKCKAAFYCNAECQRKHWPIHKIVCDSALTKASGDTIKCSSCHKINSDAKKCSKCKAVYYCNTDCQRQHWSQHKDSCGQNNISNKHGDESRSDVKDNGKTEQDAKEVTSEAHETDIQCFSCKRNNPSAKKCAKCQFAYYCNEQCQRRDFSQHKLSCGNYPKFVETLASANPLLLNLHDRKITDLEYPPRIYASMCLFANPGKNAVLLQIVAPFHHFCRLGVYVQDVKGETIHMLFHHKNDEEIFLYPARLQEVLKPGNFLHWFYPRWHRFADGMIGFRIDSLHEMEFIYKEMRHF